MAKMSTRVIGVSHGTCAACHAEAPIRIIESRRKRGLVNALDRTFDPRLLRLAECLHCFSQYPIRSTDSTARGAAQRVPSSGRDWAYPSAA